MIVRVAELAARITDESDIVRAVRAGAALISEVRRQAGTRAIDPLFKVLTERHAYREDFLYRAFVIRCLGYLSGQGNRELLDVLTHGDAVDRVQAAWAFGRRPVTAAGPPLFDLLAQPRLAGMLAQDALVALVSRSPQAMHSLQTFIEVSTHPEALRLAIECLAAVSSTPTDAGMSDMARCSSSRRPGGLHIAQLAVQGEIDVDLSRLGQGDSGGLAALMVQLGRAFGSDSRIERVYTVVRGGLASAGVPVAVTRGESLDASSSKLIRIPFGPDGALSAQDSWPYVRQIEEGLRQTFGSRPSLDALHLRFADAGSLAGLRWARKGNIPVCFTVAPDPYLPMEAAQRDGRLRRETFGADPDDQELLFRAALLDQLVQASSGLALLPRPDWQRDAQRFFALDPQRSKQKPIRVIAEGIDLSRIDAASRRSTIAPPDWLTDLPVHRRNLPVVLSVGRFHPVKGMARLVTAWIQSRLCRSFNLVLIGGNLSRPSKVEQAVLDAVSIAAQEAPLAREGILMPGSRPHGETIDIMALARTGLPGWIAPHGIYVCASDKEEFGLAILEAMATGLLVVAPDGGGPGTYLKKDAVGFPTDTRDLTAMVASLRKAAAVRSHTSERTAMILRQRTVIQDRYTIDRMATQLVDLYAQIAGNPSRLAASVS